MTIFYRTLSIYIYKIIFATYVENFKKMITWVANNIYVLGIELYFNNAH